MVEFLNVELDQVSKGLSHGARAKPATVEETRRLLVVEKGNDSNTRDTCQTKPSAYTTAKETGLAAKSEVPSHLMPQNGPDRLGVARVDSYHGERFDRRGRQRSTRLLSKRVTPRAKESSMSSSMWVVWISRKGSTIGFPSKDRSTYFRPGDSRFRTAW